MKKDEVSRVSRWSKSQNDLVVEVYLSRYSGTGGVNDPLE